MTMQKLVRLFIASVTVMLLFASVGLGTSRAQDAVTINWTGWNLGVDQGKPWVDAYQKLHPNVTINVKFEQYTDYLNDLKLSMASGTGPDVFGLQAGALANTYSQFTEDMGPALTKAYGSDWQSNFYDLGLNQTKIGNKFPGVPLFLSAAGYLWYNKTMFDQYGLKPPTTLPEWVTVTKALNDKGVTGFIQGAKDNWVNFDMYIAIANEIAPGKIYDAEAGKVKWTDPDLVKAMDIWKSMFSNGIMQKGALGISEYPDANDAWLSGKAGMIYLGIWNDASMTKTSLAANNKTYGTTDSPEFAYVPFPDVTGSGKPGRVFGGPDVILAVNKDSKVKAAALDFVTWMVGPDAQKLQAKYLSFPAIKGITLDDSDVLTDFQKGLLKTQTNDLANSVGKREFLYPEIQTALGDALQNVATDSASSQDALAAVEKASEAIKR